jgi:serine protease Do
MTPVSPRLRALAAVGFVAATFGGAAMIALRPEDRVRADGPALVATTPRPVPPATVKPAADLGAAFIAVSEAVTPAVVRIQAEHTLEGNQNAFGRSLRDIFGVPTEEADAVPAEVAGGSGFIVTADGYILTNHHVIEGADRITVSLPDKRTFSAQVVGSDPLTDVAVIRIPATGLPAIPLGDSDSTSVGEWVLAIGNPGFDDSSTLDFTVTGGIVSAKGRGLAVLGADSATADLVIEDFIQTDAVINPGNSGGPLVNLRGAVIGINTAIATTTGSYQGYGFAIPSNLARRVMRDLVQHGVMRRPLLGVEIADVTAEDAEVYRLPRIAGARIDDFRRNSPAEASGLQRHDVILAVDGVPVERVGQLQRLIAQHDPGQTVALTVMRYGEQREYRVRLSEAPAVAGASAPRGPTPSASGLGIEVVDLDAAVARQLGYDRAGGAVVARVVPGSPAARKGVLETHRILSIDQKPVAGAREARRLLREARSGSVVSLLLEDAKGLTFIANVRVP